MQVAHYSETVWGAKNHPMSDFWAERNVRTGEGSRRVYSMAGSPASSGAARGNHDSPGRSKNG